MTQFPTTIADTTRASAPALGARRLFPWFLIFFLFVIAAGLALRLPDLASRPMHTDEAVQAVKAGILYDTGQYHYDPHEFHGPSLYYLTLPFFWLSGARDFAATHEVALRLVPVVFGMLLIVLFGLLREGLGRAAALGAALLTALSPAMVFYSRYYVQEIPFVTFTFVLIACAWRYGQSSKRGMAAVWAAAAGCGAGLMLATKETSLLVLPAMLGAWVFSHVWTQWRDGRSTGPSLNGLARRALARHRWHGLIAACAALLVWALFYSSFGTNPRGPLDSLCAAAFYLQRGSGAESAHLHPWFYYLKMLLYTHNAPGPWWSEGLILGLAAVGFIAALVRRAPPPSSAQRPGSIFAGPDPFLARFLAFYTLLLTLFYSVIPYKTPWNALGFLHGMILLAGLGAVTLLRLIPWRGLRLVLVFVLALLALQLGAQARRATTRFAADTRNPYVYGHTARDAVRLADRVLELAALDPTGRQMAVKVFATGDDYWPLPWYWRTLTRVGYWSDVPPGGDLDAAVIVASPDLQPHLDAALRGRYHTEYYGLRPGVLLVAYLRADLWDRWLALHTTAQRAAPTH